VRVRRSAGAQPEILLEIGERRLRLQVDVVDVAVPLTLKKAGDPRVGVAEPSDRERDAAAHRQARFSIWS
jgi:hypothetical protein